MKTIAVDANPILSALLGGKALEILFNCNGRRPVVRGRITAAISVQSSAISKKIKEYNGTRINADYADFKKGFLILA